MQVLQTAGATYKEVPTSVGNVLTAVPHYSYMKFIPSKHFPTQSIFSRNLIVKLIGNQIFLSLISAISLRKFSKYNTVRNSMTKSGVYAKTDFLAHHSFRTTEPKISGKVLTVLTFEH